MKKKEKKKKRRYLVTISRPLKSALNNQLQKTLLNSTQHMLIDYEWLRQPETLVAVVDTGSLAVKENISFLSWRHLDEIC